MNSKLFFKTINYETLVNLVNAATNKMFSEATLKLQTDRSKELLDVITTHSFYDEESVIKLVEVITGEDLLTFYNTNPERECINLAMFKVITKDISDFEKNEVGIIIDETNATCLNISVNIDFDNEFDVPSDDYISYPTENEILNAIDRLISWAKK